MTTVIVGAGAIGLLVAGRLARAGQQVAIQARPTSAARLAASGVRLKDASGTSHLTDIPVLGTPDDLPDASRPVSLAIVCVKGYDTASTIPALESLNPTRILTLQNGIGNEDVLIKAFGAARVISGTITTSVEVDDIGAVTVTKEGGIGVAPADSTCDVADVAALLGKAGFTVESYADYRSMKWSKALLNMLGNATAAILDMPVADVYAQRELVALERDATREAVQVMARLGIRPMNLPRYPAALLSLAMRRLPMPILQPVLRKLVGGGRGGKPPSLLLDLQRGNHRSEGRFLYGAVAEAGERAGVPTPVNGALWRILNAIATGAEPWDAFRRNPDALVRAVRSRNGE